MSSPSLSTSRLPTPDTVFSGVRELRCHVHLCGFSTAQADRSAGSYVLPDASVRAAWAPRAVPAARQVAMRRRGLPYDPYLITLLAHCHDVLYFEETSACRTIGHKTNRVGPSKPVRAQECKICKSGDADADVRASYVFVRTVCTGRVLGYVQVACLHLAMCSRIRPRPAQCVGRAPIRQPARRNVPSARLAKQVSVTCISIRTAPFRRHPARCVMYDIGAVNNVFAPLPRGKIWTRTLRRHALCATLDLTRQWG